VQQRRSGFGGQPSEELLRPLFENKWPVSWESVRGLLSWFTENDLRPMDVDADNLLGARAISQTHLIFPSEDNLFSDDKVSTLWASKGGRMFRPYSQDQMMLLPASLKDFIDDNHPVHLVNDLVEKLDISVLERRYGNMGQPAYHPRLMLKAILYGFSVGVFSARKLARACRENLVFQYLTGADNPAFKTFIEFRRRHQDDMKEVFLETVRLARQLGLKSLGNVALDGTKIQANTSKHKAMSHGRMEQDEKRLKEEIESLLKKAESTDDQEDQEFGADNDGYSLEEELAYRQERLKKIKEAKKFKKEIAIDGGVNLDNLEKLNFKKAEAMTT